MYPPDIHPWTVADQRLHAMVFVRRGGCLLEETVDLLPSLKVIRSPRE
jgi:hypothetical protein